MVRVAALRNTKMERGVEMVRKIESAKEWPRGQTLAHHRMWIEGNTALNAGTRTPPRTSQKTEVSNIVGLCPSASTCGETPTLRQKHVIGK